MSKERPKTPRGLSGKLLAVEPEYRFAVYKKLIAKRRGKVSGKGSYKLEVSMGVSQIQASEVRAVIGMRGEKMSGALVRRGMLGPTVNYVTSFQAGGAASSQADKAARAKEKDDREAWLVKSCQDIVGLTSASVGPVARHVEITKCIREVKSKKST